MQNLWMIHNQIWLAIDWSSLWYDVRYFLLGFITGIILLFLSLVFIFSKNERKKTKLRLSSAIPLENKQVLKMIQEKQGQLDQTVRLTDNGYFKVAIDLSLELSQEIARYYYPDAKYPVYELSIQEMLDLSKYITIRLESLMNGKVIKLFKNSRVATLLEILNTRKKINNSKLMRLTRKMKLQQIYVAGKTVLNYANPVYWFRRLAIKPGTVLVTKEICKYIITIFGEETNKIYSKAIFKKEDDEQEIIDKIDHIIEDEGDE